MKTLRALASALAVLLAAGVMAVIGGASPAVALDGPGITGRVADADTGAPIAGAEVEALCYYEDDWGEGPYGYWSLCYTDPAQSEWITTTTAEDGTYELAMSPGTYRLRVRPVGSDYPSVVHGSTTGQAEDGTDIVVGDGPVTVDVEVIRNSVISGTVTGAGEGPLSGIRLEALAYDPSYGWDNPVGFAKTGADGTYQMHVPAGTYRVLLNAGDRSGGEGTPPVDSDDRWERTYYGGATVEEATDVVVTRGTPVTGISQELAEAPNGIISGRVASITGEAISGFVVTSYKFYEEDWGDGEVHGWWESYRRVSTDADGNYRLYVPAGEYRVGFEQDPMQNDAPKLWQPSFYRDAVSVEAAETISVTLGETTPGIDGAIKPNGRITGQVTDASGAPVVGAYVDANRLGAEGNEDWWSSAAHVRTGSDGSYQLYVPDGTYRIEFNGDDHGLVSEFYDNVMSIEQATDIAIVDSAVVSGIDASLEQGGVIEGTATVGGAIDDSVSATLYTNDGTGWSYGTAAGVDANGKYVFDGLADGTYRIGFSSYSSDALQEYYNDASTIEQATDLVIAGANTLTAEADLAVGASIAGSVTDESAAPLRGIDVTLYQAQDDGSGSVWWDSVGWASTTSAGAYSFGGLNPGSTYRIGFVDYDGNFAREYYRDAASVEQATDVIAGESGPIEVALASNAGAEAITGTVTEDAGNPVAGVTVRAQRTDTWDEAGSAITGADGTYVIDGLRAGEHYLDFSFDDDYLYAQDTSRYVEVVAGTAAVADLQVHVGGLIAGTLRDADSQPIRDAYVTAYTADGFAWSGQGYVGVDGSYTIGGLPAGTYRLEFTSNAGHRTEWFSDKASFDEADVVTVNVRETTTADAQLAMGARATGVVKHYDGTPHAWEYVVIEREGDWGWDYAGEAWTDDSGRYATGALDPGTYRIRVDANDGIHVTTYSEEFTVTDAEQVVRDIQMQRPVVTNTAAPTIDGTGIVGQTLSATSGEWDTEGVTYHYQWLRDGRMIDGAVEQTYILAEADAGQQVGVRVTATKDGYVDGTADSRAIAVSHGPLVNSQAPAVTGVPKVGETLGVDPGTWGTDGVTYAYQWLRDGSAVAGSTGATYELGPDDHGHAMSVEVTATKETWQPGVAVSEPSATVAPGDLHLDPAVTGDVRVGSVLTASVDAPEGATVTYSWQVRSPAAEPSSDTFKEVGIGADFEVRDRYKNYALRLVVTVAADGYNTATVPVEVSDRLR